MFERVVAPLLTQFLGAYVKEDSFAPEKVQLGIWSGYVVLNNLELKPEAIDLLQLPVALVRGYIGRIEFQIPWGNPGTKPTVVKVDQVYIAVETKYRWSGNQAQRRRKLALKSKLERVEAHEAKLVKRNRGDGDDSAEVPLEAAGLSGFLERLLTKIADNLQVHVRGVHLRWEDRVTTPTRPFAAGITLESLHLQTTDAAFRPSMVEATSGTLRTPLVFKALHINCLSVYWNPHMYLCDADGPIIVPTSDVATVLPELTVEQSSDANELPQDLLQIATPAVTDDGRPAGAVRSVTPLELLRARDATLSSRRAAAAHSNLYPLYHDHARDSQKGRFILPFAGSDVSSMVGGASSVASAAEAHDTNGAHRFTQAAASGNEAWKLASYSAANGSVPTRHLSSGAGSDERRSPLERNASPSSAAHATSTDSPKLSPFLTQPRRKSSPVQSSVGSTEDELYGGMLDLRTCHLETLVSLFEGMVAKRAQTEPLMDPSRTSDARPAANTGYMSGLFNGVSWLLGGAQRDVAGAADSAFSSTPALPAPISAPSKRRATQSKPSHIALSATDMAAGTSSAECPKQCFLLSPISAELRMQLSKNPRDLRHPQQAFSLQLPSLQLRLGRDQLQSILQAGSSLSSALLAAQLDALRPTRALKSRGPVAWMQAPEATEHRGVIRCWFRFAARQALQRLRRRSGHLSWMQIRRMRVMRQVYVQLYKRSLAGQQEAPAVLNMAPISSAYDVWLSTVAVSAERVESALPTPNSMGSLGAAAASHMPQSSSMASLRGVSHAWDTQKHRSAVLRCWLDPAEVLAEWSNSRAAHSRSVSASSTPATGHSAKSPLAIGPSSSLGFQPTDLSPIASLPGSSPSGAAAHRSVSASRSPFPDLASDDSPRSTDGSGGGGASGFPSHRRSSSSAGRGFDEDDQMTSPGLDTSLLSLHMPRSRPFSSNQLSVATDEDSRLRPSGERHALSPTSVEQGSGAFSPFATATSRASPMLQFPEAEAWVALCTFLGVGAPVETYDTPDSVQNCADIVAACLAVAGNSCSLLKSVAQDSAKGPHKHAHAPVYKELQSSWMRWAGKFKAATARLNQATSNAAEDDPHADLSTCKAEISQLLREEVLQQVSGGRYTQLGDLETALLHRMEECVAEEQLLAWRRTARQQLLREKAARKLRRVPRYPTGSRSAASHARDAVLSPKSALDSAGAASANSGEPPRKGSGTTVGTFPNTAEPGADLHDSASVRSGSIRDQVASTWEWAFGGGKPVSAGAGAESVFSGGRQDEADEKLQMKQDMLTEAQRRELFAVIDYDPSMLALKYPKGYVQQELQLSVESCSVNLLTAAHADSHRRVPVFAFQHMKVGDGRNLSDARAFFALKLSNAGCLVSVRPDSLKLQAELQGLAAWDLSGISHESYRAIIVPTADKERVLAASQRAASEPGSARSAPGSPRHAAVRAPAPPSPSLAAIGRSVLPTVQESPAPSRPVFEFTFETFGLQSKTSISGGAQHTTRQAATAQSQRSSSSPSVSSAAAVSEGASSKHSQAVLEAGHDDGASVNSAASSFSGVSGSAGQSESFGILWGSGAKTRHIRVEGTTRQSTRAEATKQAGATATLSALGWADDSLHSIKRPDWAVDSHAAVLCRLEPLEIVVSGHVTSFLQEFCDVPLAGVSDEFELEAAARLAMWRQRTAAKLAYVSAQRQITAVQATLASPVLRMVADATSAQSSELQFSAETMHFHSVKLRQGSELLGAGVALEGASGRGISQPAASAVPLVELCSLFDHFELEMSGLRLSLTKPGSSEGSNQQTPAVIQIVDPVDVRWSLFLCVIDADLSLPQARLHGQFSGLNAAFRQKDVPHLLNWMDGINQSQQLIGPASRSAALAREVERQHFEEGVGHRYAVLSAGVSEADYPEDIDSDSDAPVFEDEMEAMTQQPSTVLRARRAQRKASLDSSMVRGTASIVSRLLESQSVLSVNRRTAVTRNDTFVTAHSGSLLSDARRGGPNDSAAFTQAGTPLLSSVIIPFLYSSVPLAQVAVDVESIRIKLQGTDAVDSSAAGTHDADADGVWAELLHLRGALNISADSSRAGMSVQAINCRLLSNGQSHPFLWHLSPPAAQARQDDTTELPVLSDSASDNSTVGRWNDLCSLFSACIASELPNQFFQINLATKVSPQRVAVEVLCQEVAAWASPKLLCIVQSWTESLASKHSNSEDCSELAPGQLSTQRNVELSLRSKGACVVLQVSESAAIISAIGEVSLDFSDSCTETAFAQQSGVSKCSWLKCLLCRDFSGVVSSQQSISSAYFGKQTKTTSPFAQILRSNGSEEDPCICLRFRRTRQAVQDEEVASEAKDALETAYSDWLQATDAQRLSSKGNVFFKQVSTDIRHVAFQLKDLEICFPIDDVAEMLTDLEAFTPAQADKRDAPSCEIGQPQWPISWDVYVDNVRFVGSRRFEESPGESVEVRVARLRSSCRHFLSVVHAPDEQGTLSTLFCSPGISSSVENIELLASTGQAHCSVLRPFSTTVELRGTAHTLLASQHAVDILATLIETQPRHDGIVAQVDVPHLVAACSPQSVAVLSAMQAAGRAFHFEREQTKQQQSAQKVPISLCVKAQELTFSLLPEQTSASFATLRLQDILLQAASGPAEPQLRMNLAVQAAEFVDDSSGLMCLGSLQSGQSEPFLAIGAKQFDSARSHAAHAAVLATRPDTNLEHDDNGDTDHCFFLFSVKLSSCSMSVSPEMVQRGLAFATAVEGATLPSTSHEPASSVEAVSSSSRASILFSVVAGLQTVSFVSAAGRLEIGVQPSASLLQIGLPRRTDFSVELGGTTIRMFKSGKPVRCLLPDTFLRICGVLRSEGTRATFAPTCPTMSAESPQDQFAVRNESTGLVTQAGMWMRGLLASQQPQREASAGSSEEGQLWWLPTSTSAVAQSFMESKTQHQLSLPQNENLSWAAIEVGAVCLAVSKSDLDWLQALQSRFISQSGIRTPATPADKPATVFANCLHNALSDTMCKFVSLSCPSFGLEWLVDAGQVRTVQANAVLALSSVKAILGVNSDENSGGFSLTGTLSLGAMSDLQEHVSTIFEAPLGVLLTARPGNGQLHVESQVNLPALSGRFHLDHVEHFCANFAREAVQPVEQLSRATLGGTVLIENSTGCPIGIKQSSDPSGSSAVFDMQPVVVSAGRSLELAASSRAVQVLCRPPSAVSQKNWVWEETPESSFSAAIRAAHGGPRESWFDLSNGPAGYGDAVTLFEQRSRLADGRLLVRLSSPLEVRNQLSQPVYIQASSREVGVLWSVLLDCCQASRMPADLAAAVSSPTLGSEIELNMRLHAASSQMLDFGIPSGYLVASRAGHWGLMDAHRRLTTVGLAVANEQASAGLLFSRSIPESLIGRKFMRGTLDEYEPSAVPSVRTSLPVQATRAALFDATAPSCSNAGKPLSFKGGLVAVGGLAWPTLSPIYDTKQVLALSPPIVLCNISHSGFKLQTAIWETDGTRVVADITLPSMKQADILPSSSWRSSVEVGIAFPGLDIATSFVIGKPVASTHACLPCTGSLVGEQASAGVQLFVELHDRSQDVQVVGIHCVRSLCGTIVCTVFSPTQWHAAVPHHVWSPKDNTTRTKRILSVGTVQSLVKVVSRRTHSIVKGSQRLTDQLALLPDCSEGRHQDDPNWVNQNAPQGNFLPLGPFRVESHDLFESVPADWFGNSEALQAVSTRLQMEARNVLREDLLGNQDRVWQETALVQVGQAAWCPCAIKVGLAIGLKDQPSTLAWLQAAQSEIPLTIEVVPAYSFKNDLLETIQIAQEGVHPNNWVTVQPGASWPVLVLGDAAASSRVDPLGAHGRPPVWSDNCERGGYLSGFDEAVYVEIRERSDLGILLSDEDDLQFDSLESACPAATERAPVQQLFRVRVIHNGGASSWSGSFHMTVGAELLSCSGRMGTISPWLKASSSIIQSAARRTMDATSIASPTVFVRLREEELHSGWTCVRMSQTSSSDTDVIEISNSSSLTLVVKQRGVCTEADRQELLPGHGMLYAWSEPCIVPPSSGGRSWTRQTLGANNSVVWGSSAQLELEVRAVVQLPATFMQSAMTSRVLHTVEAPLCRIRRGEIKDCTVAIGGVSQQSLRLSTKPAASGRFMIAVLDAHRQNSPVEAGVAELQWIQTPASEAIPLFGSVNANPFSWSARVKVDKLSVQATSGDLQARLDVAGLSVGLAVGNSARTAQSRERKEEFQQFVDTISVQVGQIGAMIDHGASQLLRANMHSDAFDLRLALDLPVQRQNVWLVNAADISIGHIDASLDVLALQQRLAAAAAAVVRSQGALRNQLATVTHAGNTSCVHSPSSSSLPKLQKAANLPPWTLLLLGATVSPDCWQIGTDLLLLAHNAPAGTGSKRDNFSSIALNRVFIGPLSIRLSADHVVEALFSSVSGDALPNVQGLHLSSRAFNGRGIFLTPASFEADTAFYLKHLFPTVPNALAAAKSISFRILPPLPPANSMLRAVSETPVILLPVRLAAAIVSSLVYTPARGTSVAFGLLQQCLVVPSSVEHGSGAVILRPCSNIARVSAYIQLSRSFAAQTFAVPIMGLRSLFNDVATRAGAAVSLSLSASTD